MNVIKALIEGVVQDLVGFLHEDKGMGIDEAMKVVYNSKTYEKLTDKETGLHRESSAYVYEILKDEMIDGDIIQKEILFKKRYELV